MTRDHFKVALAACYGYGGATLNTCGTITLILILHFSSSPVDSLLAKSSELGIAYKLHIYAIPTAIIPVRMFGTDLAV